MEKFLHLYVLNGGTAEKAVFPTSISGYEDCEPLLIDSFDYNAKRMGDAPSITATIMYPICLDNIWSTNVYVEFKGEKYFLKQIPTSSKSNTDARFKHEVTFVSERQALNDVYLFDVVGNKEETGVEDIGYVSNSTRFEFNGTVWELAERINQSLRNSNVDYSIEIPEDRPNAIGEIETNEYKSISFQDTYVGNALQEIYNTFEIPYYFEGKTIKLGHKAKETLTEVFEYGSENALLSIAKNNSNYKVVNRITGTGSSENIPYYYPNPTPMGFINFYSKNEESDPIITEHNVDGLMSITDTELFNAKFLLSTRLKYIDITENYRYLGKKRRGFTPSSNSEHYKKDEDKYEMWWFCRSSDDYKDFEVESTVTMEHFFVVSFPNFLTQYIKQDEQGEPIFSAKIYKIAEDGSRTLYIEDIRNICNIRTVEDPNDADDVLYYPNEGYKSTYLPSGHYAIDSFYLCTNLSDRSEGNTYIVTANSFIRLDLIKQDVTKGWFDENNNITNLQTYGLEYSGEVVNGTELYAKQDETKGSKIPQCSNLMPSIYRESNGAERFYGALAEDGINDLGDKYPFIKDIYLDPSKDGEYYEFANTYNGYNPKEHTINFEDIKPTIKEMEHKGLRIDMFEDFAYDLDDNNDKVQINESTLDFKHPYFFGKLRPLGFNLFDRALDKVFMAINMTSGHVSGAKFEIEVGGESKVNLVQVDEEGNLLRDDKGDVVIGGDAQDKQNNTTNNYVWVALKKDAESFSQENKDWVYPDYKNNIVPKAKEDTFVITNILLPNEYIIAAEKRLDEELLAYLFQNNNEKFTFSIKFSRIYLAEHPNVYENLSENSTVNVKYNGFTYAFYVSSYAYKMRVNEALPEITVELTDTLTISQSALQNALNEVKQSVISIGQANVLKTGNKYFTRKDVDDTTQGKLTFMRGAEFGEYIEGNKGATVRKSDSGEWDAEFDNVKVRGKIQGALKVDGSIEVGTYTEYEDGTGNGFGVHGSDETGWNTSTDDLKVRRNAHFNKGLTVGNYINGLADGTGASISGNNEDGWTIEADYLNIRRKARFNSVEIQHTQHVGGGQVLSAAGALIDLVILHEEDNGNIFYRCYFKKQDSEGNAIFNRWMIGDQARCETFNLSSTDNKNGNHCYWRLVTGTSNEDIGVTTSENREVSKDEWVTDGEDTIFVHEYHWVDLCDTENYYTYGKGLDVKSDIPKKGDDIFLLGHRFDTNKNRQSAIYEVAGDDDGRPYYRQYVGIKSFSLDRCLEQQFMPGNNIFTGQVVVTGEGWKGLQNEKGEDLGETLEAVKEIGGDLSYSATNMLRNTGFYGEGKSADINANTMMNVDTETLSPSLEHWTAVNAQSIAFEYSPSGYAVEFNGVDASISQATESVFPKETYIVSFQGTEGTEYTISYGGVETTVTAESRRTKVKIVATENPSNTFSISCKISGSKVYGLLLERGTVASNNWIRSVYDVNPEIYRLQNLQYLANAIRNGSTIVKGGLILSNIIQLGNFVDGILKQVTSGVSGVFNSSADVALWGGGTFAQAGNTVAKLLNNPFYNPTEEELAEMAKFVVTHGGTAILNEAIVRGTVYATNGIFNGEVNASSGVFKNVVINGAYNRLVQTVDDSNYNNFLYNDGDDNEYYALLLQWGDVIHLNLATTDFKTAPQIMLPVSIPYYDNIAREVKYSNALGYRTNDDGSIVPMDIDDLRSLVGRKIVIHADNVRLDLYLNVGNIYMETSIPEDGQEFYLTSPEQGSWFQSATDGQITIGNGETFIMECLLAKRRFQKNPDDPREGWTMAEMICWSVQKITMSSKQQAGDIIAFKVNCDGYPSTWRAEKGMKWEDFVDSSYSNEQFSIDSNANVRFNNGKSSWDLYHNFDGENFTNNVKANEVINEGDNYYAG